MGSRAFWPLWSWRHVGVADVLPDLLDFGLELAVVDFQAFAHLLDLDLGAGVIGGFAGGAVRLGGALRLGLGAGGAVGLLVSGCEGALGVADDGAGFGVGDGDLSLGAEVFVGGLVLGARAGGSSGWVGPSC